MAVSISTSEYNKLLSIAKNRFPNCYEDIVHDAILEGLNFEECQRKIKTFSYKYKTISEVDLTALYQEKVCIKCNKCYPIAFFDVYKKENVTSTYNICKDCVNKRTLEWRANNRVKVRKYNKKWYDNNKESKLRYNENYRLQNNDRVKEYVKQWKANNKERVKEHSKKWYANNREYMIEYSRKYREKKKLTKELSI
ncbi:hypothetical protein ATE49_15345 [Elizabethkingia miricola]|nr:hypothetical protein [Elizabethkingia miricola]OBS12811.1 hypothetical protein ATE49_15345 [Elizabethkingia miricola]